MNMFVTKDPDKGFGAGTLFSAAPTDELTQEQERKRKSGESPAAILSSTALTPAVKTPGMKQGGAVRSASSRADGIAQRGKTRA
jgi:hypothetical protein